MFAFVEIVKSWLQRILNRKNEHLAMDPFIQKLTDYGFEVTNFLTKQKVHTVVDPSRKNNISNEGMNAYIHLAIDVQVVNVNQVKATFELPKKMKQLPDAFFKNFRMRAKGKEVYLERFLSNQVSVEDILKQIKKGDNKTIEWLKTHNNSELTTDESAVEQILKNYLQTFDEAFPLGKKYAKNNELYTELYALYEMSCDLSTENEQV